MVSAKFLNRVLEDDLLRQLYDCYHPDKDCFSGVSRKELDNIFAKINGGIIRAIHRYFGEEAKDVDKLRSRNIYINKKTENIGPISEATFKAIFNPKENESTATNKYRQQILNNILVFLDVPEKEWKSYTDLTPDTSLSDYVKLLGDWYIYRLDYAEKEPVLKRTVLSIYKDYSELVFRANFKSLGTKFEKGIIKFTGTLLTLSFKSAVKTIEMTADVDGKTLIQENKFLNAVLRSTSGVAPYAKHCVIFRAEDFNLNSFEIGKTKTISYSDASEKKTITPLSKIENSILEYLARKPKPLKARPFTPSTREEIDNRNSSFHSKYSYDSFKQECEGGWISISVNSTQEGEISVKHWDFKHNLFQNKYTATCTKKSKEENYTLAGEIEITLDTVLVNVKSNADRRRVHIIGNINDNSKIYAYTTKIQKGGQVISFREIFIREKNLKEIAIAGFTYHEFMEKGNFSYDSFTKLKVLSEYETYLLTNIRERSLSWPHDLQAFEKNFPKINQYNGMYLAFIPGNKNKSLSQITLDIDSFGLVTESFYAGNGNKDNKPNVHHGYVTISSNTLLIDSEEKHKCEYQFRINGEATFDYLEGITLYTDASEFPRADACIAIKYEQFQEEINKQFGKENLSKYVHLFEPDFIEENTFTYSVLESYFERKLNTSVSKYFFEARKSILHKQSH